MTAIKYDLSNQDPEESTKVMMRESPQPGMYVATILEITPKDAKSGDGPMLEIVFEITDADKASNKQFIGSRLWYYPLLPGHKSFDDTAWKLDQVLQALGIATKKKRKGSFDPDKHVGEEVLIRVRAGTGQDKKTYRGEVSAVLVYDEDEWESADDEEDDDVVYDEDDVAVDEDEDGEDLAYDEMSIADLKAELEERGLDAVKGKAKMIAALEADDEEEGGEDEDEEEEEEPEPEEEGGEYDDMTLAALRKEARSRDLKPTGLDKDELIALLEEDDEGGGGDDDDEEEEEEEEEKPKPRRKPAAKKSAAKKSTASARKRGGTKSGGRKRSGFPFDE